MIKKVWDFLGSVRLAITIIIIFSLVAFVGIVIPQGLPGEQYISKWGEIFGKGIIFIGIDHIFSTRWFYLLLELLSLNVLVCSTTRLIKNIKNSYRFKFWSTKEKFATFKHNHTFSTSRDVSSAEKSVVSWLKRHLYSVASQPAEPGVQISALKGKLKAYGSYLFHIGIILLFIGGLYGKMRGHSYHQNLRKGEIAQVPDRDFLVKCEWFELEKNENGVVKDYKSKLVLLDADGAVIKEKIIEVNSPLSHKGIRFYQTSYGQDQTNIEDVLLNIRGPDFSDKGVSSSFTLGEDTYIPHSDIKLSILQFIPDFVIDMKTRQAYSRSEKPNNPAVKVVLSRGTDTLFNRWIFSRIPSQHGSESNYSVSFMKYTPNYYTGIRIRNNPGVPLIWVSIIVMTLGIFLSFYSSKEKIWILIEPDEGTNSKIYIGGRLQDGFSFSQTRFENICQSIEEGMKKG